MKSKLILVLTAFLLVFTLERCKHSPTDEVLPGKPTDTTKTYYTPPPLIDTICFSSDILPLIIATCAKPGCHTQLNSYASIMGSGIIRTGKATSSELYFYAKNGSSEMRNSTQSLIKVDTASLNKIAKWINQGAINSVCNYNCDTMNVKYSTHIVPILQQNCLGCHTSSGTLLTNYTQVKAKVTDGKLYCSVSWASGCQVMPQGGAKLSTCKIRAIKIWIDAGSPNN